jgi:hypothetical protein
VKATDVERGSLQRLVASAVPPLPGPEDREGMARRIELGAELSETALDLAIRRAGERGGRVA